MGVKRCSILVGVICVLSNSLVESFRLEIRAWGKMSEDSTFSWRVGIISTSPGVFAQLYGQEALSDTNFSREIAIPPKKKS